MNTHFLTISIIIRHFQHTHKFLMYEHHLIVNCFLSRKEKKEKKLKYQIFGYLFDQNNNHMVFHCLRWLFLNWSRKMYCKYLCNNLCYDNNSRFLSWNGLDLNKMCFFLFYSLFPCFILYSYQVFRLHLHMFRVHINKAIVKFVCVCVCLMESSIITT